jgi:cell division protein FtsL
MKILITFVLAAASFVTAVQIVLSQHQARKTFMEVQKLEIVRNELNEEWGRLQLEQSTWATDDRIERLARDKLGMRHPDAGKIVLLAE